MASDDTPPERAERPGASSITSVARRAGVSIATVSRIVNGVPNKASAETVEKVRRAIAELGYRPVSVGRALRRRESRLVALLAANLGNPAMTAIAASAEHALQEAGYVMVLCDTHDRPEMQDEYLLEMRAQFVRGTVLLGAVPSPQLAAFQAAGEPILFVNRRSPAGEAPFVGIDNRRAGRDVAAYFLGRGIVDVAVIHGSLASSATAERVAGFREAMAAAGASLPATRILTEPVLDHLMIGHGVAERLLRDGATPPAGLFCLSDLIAYGAHKRLAEAGLADFAPRRGGAAPLIVGFDDNPLNDWLAPWLTSVRVPYDAFGQAIVEGLEGLWSGDSACDIALPHRLVVR
jgi:LacI family transcriptional regulator